MPLRVDPKFGYPVSYRQFSWLEMVERAWGGEWGQPIHGVYEFSNGRRFDSTDQYESGIYRKR